ncbi:MAG TPA: ATP-binding protein [Aggregatilineales bacterium]|nr:ATP-binding protein [Aggregatilineales bacterium]
MGDTIDIGYIQQLEAQVANLKLLLEINNVLNTILLKPTINIDALLGYLMDAAAKLTNSQSASVILWKEETGELFIAATTTDASNLIGRNVPLDSIAGTIFKEQKVVQVDDATHDPRHYEGIDQTNQFITRSLLGVPLIAKDKVIGVLEVINKRTLPWTIEDTRNLTILAGEAAIAIEVGQLVMALQQANIELADLDNLKNDFIAIASHELRTPLGIIMGYASFLQEEDDASVSEQASKVMESAMQLRRIIDAMINLRYLKQKTEQLQREPIPLGAIMDDLQHDTLAVTSSRTHKIKFTTDDVHTRIFIDRSRLLMALNNLLSNAVTYSPQGGAIEVHAWANADGKEATISIKDAGIGIDGDQLDRIFKEFYQVEDHMVRRYGGLGIGLSITQAVVEAHHGKVWAESDGLGSGATFFVTLPLAETAE